MINGTTTRSKIGYLVAQSPKNNRAFVYADGGSTGIVGVVQQNVAPNQSAQIARSGTAKVSIVGTVQRGDIIRARKKTDKGFVGQAIRASSTETDYFRVGIALESGSGLVSVSLQLYYVGAEPTDGVLPPGGSAGQILKKKSATDYDTEWGDESGGESHLRAHQIDSADDHPPVAEEKRGKIVATNDATGAVELIGKDQVGAILDIYAADDPYFPIEHLMVQKPGVSPDTRVTTMLKPRGLLWGGMVSWLDGMWFGVSGAIYYIAGTMLFAPDIKLELDEADPDNPRIDVIVATSNSEFVVITGTPGANPVKPYVDPVAQIEIAEITVPAGATGFGGSIFREVIYNENIEWTGTGVGLTVDFDSTTLPFFGSKCADAGAFGNNDYIKFVNGSPVTVADYDMMFLALKLKAAANATLTATFYLAGVAISSPAMVRFNAPSLAWQQLYLILQEVKFKGTQFDEVRFRWLRIGAGTDPGFYLDYVRLERGISVPPQSASVILVGDVTGNGVTGSPVQTTLKTVNEDVGEFGSATKVPKITVDAKGRVTAVSEEDITGGGGGSTQLTAIPATDKTASGITTQLTANEAQAFGDVVKINSSGKAQLAKADVIANATALAMCVSESVEADATGNYLLIGFVRNDAWDWTVGGDIYLTITGTSGNTLSQTSPFAADPIVEDTVVQLLGVANSSDTIYFNPQLVQVELKPN